jgi:thiol-disulfide isomerase/thioredoxin
MYVVAPPEKLTSEATAKILRTIAAPLRGHFTILAANPAEEEPGMTPTMYPIAATFALNHTLTDYFVGVLSSANGTRYTCNLPAGVEELTQEHVSELIKCGQEVLAGGGLRIFNSQPAPADPIQGNFTVAVGDTLLDIIHNPEKDVLLEVYAPWCSACRAFAPEFARAAAALAGVDSVVVVKMDGSDNDHKEFDVKEYPTLLFYPAEKGAQPIRVDINTGKDLIEFVHTNAKIGFTLPEYAQFKDMEVDLTEFGPLGEETEEDGVADVYDVDEDTETAPENKEESGSSDAGHDEL